MRSFYVIISLFKLIGGLLRRFEFGVMGDLKGVKKGVKKMIKMFIRLFRKGSGHSSPFSSRFWGKAGKDSISKSEKKRNNGMLQQSVSSALGHPNIKLLITLADWSAQVSVGVPLSSRVKKASC